MNKVESKFAEKAYKRAGLFLLAREDALQFVEECKSQGINILGIDGFLLTESSTQPSLENSIDFSTESALPNVFSEARKFLEGRDRDLYFEIVCSD